MKERRVMKETRCSVIEANNDVHEFVAGDELIFNAKISYRMLNKKANKFKKGYVRLSRLHCTMWTWMERTKCLSTPQ